MICVEFVEIGIFVIGGIGGVYCGVEIIMDVLVDLEELVKINVVVVCVGVKLILDLNLIMEYLEIKGVLVIGY